MSRGPLGRWATEAKQHLLKYRPKMAKQLEEEGKLDDWARSAAEKAGEEYSLSVENGMFPLEAESEARKNYMFLPAEDDLPQIGVSRNTLPDPASLVTIPGVNRRGRSHRT
jgi:hypothetical protein